MSSDSHPTEATHTANLMDALEGVKRILEMVEGHRQEILRTGYPEDLSWSMAAEFYGMLMRTNA